MKRNWCSVAEVREGHPVIGRLQVLICINLDEKDEAPTTASTILSLTGPLTKALNPPAAP